MKRIVQYFKQLPEKEATKFLVIYYLVGISGFLIPATRNIFELLIPLSLVVNLFLLLLFHGNFNTKHLLFFGGVIVFTFVIEAIGVNTGLLFGEYIYGKSLPGKLFGTPLLIGFNWLMLTYGAIQLVRSKPFLKSYVIVVVGLLMTGFDYLMEPVAMKTDMWTWMYNEVPLQNYVMWFMVSTVIATGYELFQIETKNKIAGRIFLFQAMFFAVLHLFLS